MLDLAESDYDALFAVMQADLPRMWRNRRAEYQRHGYRDHREQRAGAGNDGVSGGAEADTTLIRVTRGLTSRRSILTPDWPSPYLLRPIAKARISPSSALES